MTRDLSHSLGIFLSPPLLCCAMSACAHLSHVSFLTRSGIRTPNEVSVVVIVTKECNEGDVLKKLRKNSCSKYLKISSRRSLCVC